MVFNQKYSNFKIRSIFGVYLENSPVNTFDQPHGSDQCGYIHLLHGSDLMETVVRVGNLCRLGCQGIHVVNLNKKHLNCNKIADG